VGAESTEIVRVIAQRPGAAFARDYAIAYAHAYELRVDHVQEEPHLLSTELLITVTGCTDQVERFREEISGKGLIPDGTDASLLVALWQYVFKRLKRRRHKGQTAPEPTQQPHP
jgi:hypothetical protein